MKRFLYMILIAAALLACFGAASAEEYSAVVEGKIISRGEFPEAKRYHSRASTDELENHIVSQLRAAKAEIDISKYRYPIETFNDFFCDLINHHPELFYVVVGETYYYYDGSGCVTKVVPGYAYSGAELSSRIAEFEEHVADIVSYTASAGTDIGRLLRVNDYFCVNFEYDETYSVYRPDQLFNGKTGVCQAYMLGYAAVLNELGIENTYASSDAMNHIWNVVKLDGEWYHIDVTWNDPVPDQIMGARHYYFLLSDGAFRNAGHYDWVSSATADSSKYDTFFWRNLDTPLPVSGDNVYYFSYGAQNGKRGIYKYDCASEKSALIYSVPVTADYFPGYMAFAADGSFLYYGENNNLYSLGFDGGLPALIYTHDSANERIWSAWREGSRIKLLVGPSLYGRIITVQIPNWTSELIILPGVTELEIGESAQLRLVAPKNPALTITGTWSSGDAEIASVGGKGIVTGRKMGITSVSAARGEESAEAIVIVHSGERITLPESAVLVEKEAFAGISAEEILIPYGVEAIGDRAFADCPRLKMITIPETVESIGTDAFAGRSEDLVLLVREDSFAHSYARENEIDFVLIG